MQRPVGVMRSLAIAAPSISVTGLVPLLGWLLASLATALGAHALIDWIGCRLDASADLHADAYAGHAHVALVPIALLICIVFASMLLHIAVRAIARESHCGDGVAALAQELRSIRPPGASAFVACGGVAILIAMEFLEQAVASGHVGTVAETLGGNVALGLAIVACVATALTGASLRVAGALGAITAATALSIVSWFACRLAATLLDVVSAAGRVGHPRGRARNVASSDASSRYGLRAPPTFA